MVMTNTMFIGTEKQLCHHKFYTMWK